MNDAERPKLKRFYYLLGYVLVVFFAGFGLYSALKQLPKVLPASDSSTQTYSGSKNQVVLTKIVDGDTVKVLLENTEQSVRLIGINAPEANDCRGDWSRTEMEKLLAGQTVFLEEDPTQGNKDKYGRLLRYIHTGSGLNVNAEMVEIGAAKEYTYDKDYKYKRMFIDAQDTAKINKLGVWGVPCD
ncbi:hypothetical protein A3K01_00090 [candidate division WWE3 bacterium RIFOXYD1_FULL_43_17]|uniref:TNase-like domain-containing protein n=1 Tax=candidate division WWE3 bacterium RIFOXYD1_FULL_43_17 TaxID=1802652 RepID=A0A1F4XBY2_UNCKA|nr:MAG: hypothetical protein A3K01_00090 [candidate division WWE3 bacterium RIFOXYD1_FULL_43_17]